MLKIFLSYAHDDYDFARSLAAYLEAQEFTVWWDHRLIGGEDYRAAIDTHLDDSDIVIVLWTPASAVSHWVMEEADEGARQEKLVPIIAKEVEIPRGFRAFHTINLSSWDGQLDFERLNDVERAISAIDPNKRSGSSANKPNKSQVQFPLGKAAARNAIILIVAAFIMLLYSFFDHVNPDSGATQMRVRIICALVLFVGAGIIWTIKRKTLASVAVLLALIVVQVSIAATLGSYEDARFGLASGTFVLNLAGAFTWFVALGAIRAFEALLSFMFTIAFYLFCVLNYAVLEPIIIVGNIANIALICTPLLVLKLHKIQKFYY